MQPPLEPACLGSSSAQPLPVSQFPHLYNEVAACTTHGVIVTNTRQGFSQFLMWNKLSGNIHGLYMFNRNCLQLVLVLQLSVSMK